MKYVRSHRLFTYIALFFVFFGAIYFYFVDVQTRTIYGDDLYIYKTHNEIKTFPDILDASKTAFKFRPINNLVAYAEVQLFQKWLEDYFIFSVAIQAIIATIFCAIVNVFLRSLLFSSLVSLTVAFSRFSYYSITQLLNGGPMEGLALVFFLAVVYNLVIYMTYDENVRRKSQVYYLMWAVFFANLAIYTHERYLVLFPVIVFLAFFHPFRNRLSLRQKTAVCFAAVASVFVNYSLKIYVYKYPFLLGTGVTSLTHEFQLSKQLGFLRDALASIIQLNYGAGYEMGLEFYDTKGFHSVLIVLVLLMLLVIISWYVISILRSGKNKDRQASSNLKLVLCLFLVFLANLAPSVSTIDLELRWLQASFCVFVLIVVAMVSGINTSYPKVKAGFFMLFIVTFLLSDYNYMIRMSNTFWMKGSEWQATCFKDAASRGMIRKDINTIFYLEDKKTDYTETNINWLLDNGNFFDFYQGKSKNIVFIDSLMFKDSVQLNYLIHFNRAKEQILLMTDHLSVNTDSILKKRDEYLAAHGMSVKTDSVGK